MTATMKRKLQALALFLLIGIVKLPIEQHLAEDLRSRDMLYAPLDYSARDAVGQMGFAATLGGLRSLAASVTYLMGFSAFEDVDWPRVDMLFGLTTLLQPRFDVYWDDAASHMAYDAASYYKYDETRPTLYRKKLYREHVQRGIDILNEGLRHLPDNKRLHATLAEFYSRRQEPPDHEAAGQHYMAAYKSGGLPVLERMGAYEWTQLDNAPERWKQAYAVFKRDVDAHIALTPGAVRALTILEQKLGLPPSVKRRQK